MRTAVIKAISMIRTMLAAHAGKLTPTTGIAMVTGITITMDTAITITVRTIKRALRSP